MNFVEKTYRRIAIEAVTAGQELLIEVPRLQDIYSIGLRLAGTLAVSVDGTAIPAHSPAQFLTRVDLLANGKEVLEQVPFRVSVHGNYGRRFDIQSTAPAGFTAAGSPYTFECVGWLDRINKDGPRPKDTAFQAYLTTLLQLRASFGNVVGNLITGGTATISNTNLEVFVDSRLENAGGRGEAKTTKKRTWQTAIFTGANSNLRVSLPRGNHVRLCTLLVTDDQAPSNTLLNNAAVNLNGVDTRINASYEGIRALNRSKTEAALPDGFVVLDSSEEGKVSEFWDVRSASEFDLVLDVGAPGGTGRVEVITEEFIS